MEKLFLPKKGNYRDLKIYKISFIIYVITSKFIEKYLKKGDRTIDQMLQAARSGKQNIAEGCMAGITSSRTEIHLINVARGSLQELCLDYEDYLVTRSLERWELKSEITTRTREYCRSHNEYRDYKELIRRGTDEQLANLAIILIHQNDFMMERYINWLQKEFLKNGGIKEQMYNARVDYRSRNRSAK